jgi:hypothetical protein
MGSGGRLWKGCAEREGCVSFGEKRDLVWSLAHPVDSIQPRIDPALRLMASATLEAQETKLSTTPS